MKKKKTVQIFAILGLLWIIVSVVWTWLLVVTAPTQSTENNTKDLTQEDLQKIIDQNNIKVKSWSWKNETTNEENK